MKSSLPSRHSQNEAADDEGAAERSRATARPPLMRSPPERLSETSPGRSERRNAPPGREGSGTAQDARRPKQRGSAVEGEASYPSDGDDRPGADDERLAKLKDAMNARLLMQQGSRRSYGSPKADVSSPRVAAIQEESGVASPQSINAMLARTTSNESTESTRTIRAGKAARPSMSPYVTTPSYPFPHVPSTSRGWPSQFHQPFTALSPTATAGPNAGNDGFGEDGGVKSGGGTPVLNTNQFGQSGVGYDGAEDPRFPTPDLYDMVLQLNAEPGLEQWWATVTNLMHDHFRADRATLVAPRDASEIENVPWGVKATFSMNGVEESVSQRPAPEQPNDHSDSATVDDLKRQELHPERFRPRLEARHSYAGHGRDVQHKARPPAPQRTATHAAGVRPDSVVQRWTVQRFDSTSTQPQSSLGNPEFSSVGDAAGPDPYAAIFPMLRDLDREIRPLIDSRGINRVLERGRVVTVTRDYLSVAEDVEDNVTQQPAESDSPDFTPDATPRPSVAGLFGNYRKAFTTDSSLSKSTDFEEYEQHPSSPWSQSPAPSPAIQTNEEANPFFTSKEQHVEESFNPAASPKDYSRLGQVEAIGVDRASTVIHIPLIHPTISQPMQPMNLHSNSDDQRDEDFPGASPLDIDRKAPIAILSILSPTVPFPRNFVQSLQLLGPHLATSFATSQQFSSTRPQAVTIRHRRTETGQTASSAPMTIVPTSLEDIMNAEVDGYPDAMSASITTPSDYSGQSPFSTTSSIVGTPGWDPATHGWMSSKSAAGTPALTGSEIVDSYFEAKKRSSKRRASNTSLQGLASTPVRSTKKASGSERKPSARKSSSNVAEDSKKAQAGEKSRDALSAKEDQSGRRDATPPKSPQLGSSHRYLSRPSISHAFERDPERQQSQLHSHGADLQSSFGGLPSSTSSELPTPSVFGHNRKSSYPEGMPPPSERLLRTIIDAVPVQIFTAEPDTGKLTWINSKFMVYRAQDANEVLSDPWQAIHPEDRNEFMATWHRSLRTAQQLQQKIRLKRFDGSYRWFYVRAAPLKDKNQKIVHWIGTMMDFHEQSLAQETAAKQQETAASESKYRALANSSPQIVFAVNKAKGIIFCNTQWVQFSGQSERQARGVGFMDHVHPDDLVKCKLPTFDEGSDLPQGVPTSVPPELRRTSSGSMELGMSSPETERARMSPSSSPMTPHMPQRRLSELASTGILKVSRDADGRPSYSTEVRLKSKDGEYRWHLVRVLLAEPLLQKDEGEETWYGTCTDISDHKALERDLKEAMDEKSRFLSNMSHEIRTPLNGITGMVNFLIDSSLTVEQLEHVNIIRASTEGLRGLINDILDLSKAEAGMIQLNMDWLYVRALIEEVNDLTSAMAIDKGIELNYLVEEDVPMQIKGDRFRIRQILLNIIGNAIKFTQKGEVFIHCSTQQAEDYELADNELYIKFEVIDTGRGFTDEEAEVLFKRFSQIDGSSTRQHGGSGLGLVISRQLAQLHGGDMRAKGEPDKGSIFTCLIKATLPSSADEPPTPLLTPGDINIPILPISPGPFRPTTTQTRPAALDASPVPTSKLATVQVQSPSPQIPTTSGVRHSPVVSSAGSDPSLSSATRTSSIRSERSSASSSVSAGITSDPKASSESSTSSKPSKASPASSLSSSSDTSGETLKASRAALASPGGNTTPPMYSILVVCSLKYSREATVQHIDKTLPKNVPHQITAKERLSECEDMVSGDDPVIFTHIVVVLHDVAEIATLMHQVLTSEAHQSTTVVIITDLVQKRRIMEHAPSHDYEKLRIERRVLFVFKPLKPSRLAEIFDPQKERETSLDRNQDSAQQVAFTQKQVFEEVTKRLGNRDKRVLLVEDNKTNQLVVKKFLAKVSINVDTAIDGIECTQKVFSKPHGHYSIILCDLHMPNKDGYQTCQDIRKWERDNQYPHLPVVALSANVLGDVHEKCVASGFNSYLTKPVDFKELGAVLVTFMDPYDPNKPHEFMKMKLKKRKGAASAAA